MAVNYEYYRIFYYVAKYHSFTQAADVLGNSQPNITRAMNNLEHELGCRLFIRTNRGAALTPEGEKLFVHVAAAQSQLQSGEEELADATGLKNGTLSIGASETALHGILLEELERFHEDYPGIRIRILNHSTPQAVNAVRNGSVDLSVVTTPCDVEHPLESVPLRKFTDILVGGKLFKPLSQKKCCLRDLAEYPLVSLGPETKTYEFYKSFYMQNGLVLQPDIEASTTDQIMPIVLHNLGIGFVPEEFAFQELAAGNVFQIKLEEKIPPRYICLIKDRSRPLSAAALQFASRLEGHQY